MAQSGLAEAFRLGIRKVMQDQGITQHELSVRTGMSYPGINRVLTGKQTVTLPRAEKLAEALGTTFERIIQNNEVLT